MIIYRVINNINNKCYIGQTIKTLKNRKSIHLYRFNSGSKLCFYNALRKYGWNNFQWEILCECNSKDELDEMEFHYIKQYDSYNKGGYNMTWGGDKGTYGYKHTDEAKQKISKIHKGKKGTMLGKKHTAETKRKISEKKKGKISRRKLCEEEVNEILELFHNVKLRLKDVGKIMRNGREMSYERQFSEIICNCYNVTYKCIENLVRGETWLYVQEKYKV